MNLIELMFAISTSLVVSGVCVYMIIFMIRDLQDK